MPLPTSGQMSYSDLANEFGGANSAQGTGGTRVYLAGSYAYTVPPGVTAIQVLVVAGGGGGGIGVNPTPPSGYDPGGPGYGGGGGGGGGVYNGTITVTPGETLSITVGASGAGGDDGHVQGYPGSNTSIVGIFGTISATGGAGGYSVGAGGAVGGTAGSSSQGGGYSGGTGANGAGGGGGYCGVGSNGVTTFGGNGGGGGYRNVIGGGLYNYYGSGGGGGATTGSPGAGGYNGGLGGSASNASTTGNPGTGAGGGGGGGADPYRAGSGGGSGVVLLYAPATMSNVNIENYYRGQGYVPDIYRNQGVPYWVSGTHPSITVGTDFYNATNLFYWNYVLGAGLYATGLCILAAATADGYTNNQPLIATVTINGVLGASATSTYALDTGTGYNAVPTITVNVGASGIISGHGGGALYCSGGTVLGGDGGTAINLQVPTTVNNNGIIQGGGAAAAAERGVYPGGAGYGYGVGVQGNQGTVNQNGTVESGGALQAQKTGKKSTGYSGYGGGWVSEAGQSPSTNGYATTGGYIPGNGFTAGSVANLNLAVHGTIRGLCGL